MKRISFTPEADGQVRVRRDWWREHRDKAPELFDQELAAVLERVRSSPGSFPAFAERRGHVVRRALLPKTAYHLYFIVPDAMEEIVVVAVGGGRQRRPPRLRLQDAP